LYRYDSIFYFCPLLHVVGEWSGTWPPVTDAEAMGGILHESGVAKCWESSASPEEVTLLVEEVKGQRGAGTGGVVVNS